jgi:hypothetical protein
MDRNVGGRSVSDRIRRGSDILIVLVFGIGLRSIGLDGLIQLLE